MTLTTWLEYLWKILFYLLLSIYRSTFEEKVGADEKVVGARTHLGKGFAGKYYINITLEKLEDPF